MVQSLDRATGLSRPYSVRSLIRKLASAQPITSVPSCVDNILGMAKSQSRETRQWVGVVHFWQMPDIRCYQSWRFLMAVEVFNRDNAPGFAKHSSTFKNDERCVEVHFVTGVDYNEVLVETLDLWSSNKLIDYDVNFSTEGGVWVGVTCEDV
jgi:hypothetical protein